MEVNYELIYFREALKDLDFWKKSGNKLARKKIELILSTLESDPHALTPGEPEKLKYVDGWARRINKKDRVTYIINEAKKEVVILRMRGHYGNK